MDEKTALKQAIEMCQTYGADEENARSYGGLLVIVGEKYIRGHPVFEFGCGGFGGLAETVMGLGATGYKGVDINAHAAEASRQRNKNPLCKFYHEDPRAMIPKLKEPHVIVSSAVLDSVVINPDSPYAKEFIKVIADHLTPNTVTIHLGIAVSDFEEGFHEQSLIRVPERISSVVHVYQKRVR